MFKAIITTILRMNDVLSALYTSEFISIPSKKTLDVSIHVLIIFIPKKRKYSNLYLPLSSFRIARIKSPT